MANRFVDTNKWSEDWYCELKGEYQKLWDYICDHCDNAGIWKPNKIDFEIKTGFRVSLDSFFKKVNGDKLRIASLANGRWFLPGFIQYQWFNKKQSFNLVLTNPRHKHIFDLLTANGITHEMVRGLKEVCGTSMAMAKEAEVLERGAGGNLLQEGLIFDAEKELLANHIEFERICMSSYQSADSAKSALRKYHLYLQEKDRYPIKRKSAFAGFEKWLLNEPKNGAHQPIPSPKKGTSEARIDALKNWGLSGGKQVP